MKWSCTGLAQQVEHTADNREVGGANPLPCTSWCRPLISETTSRRRLERVPEQSMGLGRNPSSLVLNTPGANPGALTGRNESRGYYTRNQMYAGVAQPEERWPEEPCVIGANPVSGTASAVSRFTSPATSRLMRGTSSIGRASALQAEGSEFDSPVLHAFESVAAAAANLPTVSGFCRGSSALAEQPPRKRQVASSSLAPGPVAMTGLTTTGRTDERVAEWLGTGLQNQKDVGPIPTAFSGRNEPENCCGGTVVQRNGHPVVARKTGVQLPPVPQSRKLRDSDTQACRGRAVRRNSIEVMHRPSKPNHAGASPASCSRLTGAGCGGYA